MNNYEVIKCGLKKKNLHLNNTVAIKTKKKLYLLLSYVRLMFVCDIGVKNGSEPHRSQS